MKHREEVFTRHVEEKIQYIESFDGEVSLIVTGMDGDKYNECVREIVDYEKCVRGQLVRKMIDNKVFTSLGTLDRKLSNDESKKKADWLLDEVDCHLTGGNSDGSVRYYLFMPKTEDDIKCMLACLALAQDVREYFPGTNFDRPYSSKCGSSDIKCGGVYVVCTFEGSLVSCTWASIYDWNRMAVAVQNMANDMHTLFNEAMRSDNVESGED